MINSEQKYRLNFGISYVLMAWYGSIVFVVAALLYCVNVGFELLDEGYYLQGYVRQQPIFFNMSGFHYIVRWLPYSDDIIAARLYRIVLHLVCGVVLARALHKHMMPGKTTVELAAYTIMGNLLSYLFGPLTISYNTLTLFFLQLLLAVYLDFRQLKPVANRSYLVQITTFGTLLGLLAVTKITSAALFALLFGLDQWLQKSKTLKERFASIIYAGATSLLSYVGLITLFFGERFIKGLHLITKPDNPFNAGHFSAKFLIVQILVKPFTESNWVFVFALILLLIYLAYYHFKLGQWLLSALMSVVMLYMFYTTRKIHFQQFTGADFMMAWLYFTLAAFVHQRLVAGSRHVPNPKLAYILMLLVLPLVGYFGSTNPPYLGFTHFTVFYVLTIIYLNEWLKIKFNSYTMPFLLSAIIIFSQVVEPYNNPPVWQQNNLVKIRERNIWVSNEVKQQLADFASIKEYIHAQKPLIALQVLNGILYANKLTTYYTFQYNDLLVTLGYIRLLLLEDIPPETQIVVEKNDKLKYLMPAIDQLLKKVVESGYKWQVKMETTKYRLIVVSR